MEYSNKQEFIQVVAKYAEKHRTRYGVEVVSPVVAQAVLESSYGTSELALNANNFFGIKRKKGRCPSSCGEYIKVGSEQNADGTYVSSSMKWFKFQDIEQCVIGYFDFINIERYSALKGVTEPKKYLDEIKKAGYATSNKYVDNLMRVIQENNLTRFDKKESEDNKMAFTNSPLVTYTKLSPNCTKPRKASTIDTIIIHCVVGQVTIQRLGEIFANPNRNASSNYGVDKEGRIGMFVEECNRSWCSGGRDRKGDIIRVNGISGADIDHRAISIEVASDTTAPYAVKPAAYEALITLVADICKRNNIKEMLWRGDKTLVGNIKKQNMAVHRWFANKSCPGDYLYSRMGNIASSVNKLLSDNSVDNNKDTEGKKVHEILVNYKDIKVNQIYNFNGTYNYSSSAATAKAVKVKASLCKITKKASSKTAHPIHVRAVDSTGKYIHGVYGWVNIADLTQTVDDGSEFPYIVEINTDTLNIRSKSSASSIKVGVVKRREKYTIVDEVNGWGKLKSGKGWICLSYTRRV